MAAAVVLGSRLLLAAVFAVAAAAKLMDRDGTREAVVEFGAPDHVGPALSLLIPVAELTVAVLLLPAATALAGAVAALALLLLFSLAIAVNLMRGRAPDCHCFGQLHSEPAGPRTLVRNGALACVAGLVVAGTLTGTDTSAVAWIGDLEGATAVTVAVGAGAVLALATGTVAYTSLLRSYGRVLLRLEQAEQTLAAAGLEVDDAAAAPRFGLEPGTPAPAFAELDELLAPGLPLLLVFASPRCGPCKTLLAEVAEWQAQHADRMTVAVASAGAPEEVRAEAAEVGLDRVLVDEGRELYHTYAANGTPSAVVIEPGGRIASWVAPGPSRIEALATGVIDAPRGPLAAAAP